MKTYFQNGTVEDIPYFCEDNKKFSIQELDGASPDKYVYAGDNLKFDLDIVLVYLYDKFRDLYFPDTEKYYAEVRSLPIFVQEVGQNSDCSWTADLFNKVLQTESLWKFPNIFKHLYLVDVQFWVGTIQNLLNWMESAFINYYVGITKVQVDTIPASNDATMVIMSPSISSISGLLETYFIKAYSILDMLSKIAYELQSPQADFSTYKKMKCADVLWGARKRLTINNTSGTVFEKCDLISIIEALRNEVVHNGSWELHPKLFVRYVDRNIAERYMLFPDITQGRLATVKNRRHFFGQGIKVNEVLFKIHKEYQTRIFNTVKLLNETQIKVDTKS